MPRFFSNNILDNKITIEGEDAKHITKVLRMRIGEKVTICNMNGTDYECEILSLGDIVSLLILSKDKNKTEPSINITLYQALPKSDKMEFIIKKAVELGVTRIVPFQSKFCVTKLDDKSAEKKLLRYNKIAFEAAKQSGRGIIPLVDNVLSFEQAVLESQNQTSILYYEHGGEKTNNIISKNETKVNLFIGSEGGFSQEEVIFAKENNFKIATLGKLILRCETAPIVATTLVLTATDNM